MKVFQNEVYEQQRINLEKLYNKRPDDWFLKSEMEKEPQCRVGFAPIDRKCWNCGKDITKGENGITLEKLGNYIITDCPHCHQSYCD